MPRPQALQYLTENQGKMFETSIRSFAGRVVAELVKTAQLDPARVQAYQDWIIHTLLADFNSERASQIATENKFDEHSLARLLDAYLKKLA